MSSGAGGHRGGAGGIEHELGGLAVREQVFRAR